MTNKFNSLWIRKKNVLHFSALKKGWFLLIMLLFFVPGVYGFGLSSDYLKDNTLLLAPGANYEYRINIQNPLPENIFVNLNVNDENKITRLNSTIGVFEISARNYDAQIPLYISIPWYVSEGKTYDISYRAEPVEGEGQNQGIGFGVSLSRSFSVKISKAGFISRGIYAPPKKSVSEITSNTVKKLYAHSFQIGEGIALMLILAFVISLIWKRSEIITAKISRFGILENNSCKKYDGCAREETVQMSYSTLPEFYNLMVSVDAKTFENYISTYRKELYAWIGRKASQKFAYELFSTKTRKEFFTKLKNELQKK